MVPVNRGLAVLAPRFLERVEQVVEAMQEKGWDPWIFETGRTKERQEWLYAQGRTRPGSIVTKAKSHLTSWHGYGLAVDIIDAKEHWGAPAGFWEALGKACADHGLTWGGHWKSFPDRPHCQWGRMPAGPTVSDVALAQHPGTPAVWQKYGATDDAPRGWAGV